jgi:glucose-6-phosphate 1-dehydrogenase
MVQNHALQLLCGIAMEPPINAHADAIRDEKLKVLRALKPWTTQTLNTDAVRGQYVAGGQMKGYREEAGIDAQSRTETYVALRCEIANWRWAGVPFFIRTGKRLAGRDARIVVTFRPTPHPLFPMPAHAVNRLVIHLQPKDGLELHLNTLGPDGSRTQTLSHAHLDLDFDKRFGTARVGAYERLLLDVMDGRLNLFVRRDEQEEAWRWVEPMLELWQSTSEGLSPYAAGSWGPGAASALVAREGFSWHEEVPGGF